MFKKGHKQEICSRFLDTNTSFFGPKFHEHVRRHAGFDVLSDTYKHEKNNIRNVSNIVEDTKRRRGGISMRHQLNEWIRIVEQLQKSVSRYDKNRKTRTECVFERHTTPKEPNAE